MRIADYLTTAVKSVRRQSVRSSLTIIAMAISAVILLILTAISIGMRQAVTATLNPDATLTRITVTPSRTANLGGMQEAPTQKLDDTAAMQLQHIPYAQVIAPATTIWEIKSFAIEGGNKNFLGQAQGVVANEASRPALAAGEFFANNDQRHVVIVGQAYAKELGFGDNSQALLGKTVTITTQNGYIGEGATIPTPAATQQQRQRFAEMPSQLTAIIVGVTARGVDENALLLPMQWARGIRTHHTWVDGRILAEDQIEKEGYTHMLVKADVPEHVQTVVDSIEQLGFGTSATLAQLNRLLQLSSVVWVGLGAISLIAMIAASLGVVNTMLMAVTEQRFTIGVLRACGATKSTIIGLILIEAAILGCIGGAIGGLLSMGATNFVNQYIEHILLQQHLTVVTIAVLPWWLLSGGVAVTVIFAIVSGLYPAYRAAKQDPSTILAGN